MKRREDFAGLADRAVEQYGMLDGVERVVAGFSGGADSTALVHYLRFEKRLDVTACHVNHCLRGDESRRDEEFVRKLCEKWGIPLRVKTVDAAEYARKTGNSIEEAGRELRYGFFEEVRRDTQSDRIATAHTLSDNGETLLLHLVRGTGLNGLCGIPPVRGRIIRPLLFCSRQDVEDYCREKGLTFVTDSTNLETVYSRNLIRHRVVPVLKELNPRFEEAAGNTIFLLNEENAYLEEQAERELSASRTEGGFSMKVLNGAAPALKKRVLGRILDENRVERSAALIFRLEELLQNGRGRLDLPGTAAWVERGVLRFGREPEPVAFFEMKVFPDPGAPVKLELPDGRRLKVLICEKNVFLQWRTQKKVYKNLLYLALDYDKIKGKIFVRQRRTGDRIAFAGRNGSKSLKKLCIDQKLTAYEKSVLPVISDEKGTAGILGMGPDRRCAPDEGSKRILLFAPWEEN